jgi:hypothetical protein
MSVAKGSSAVSATVGGHLSKASLAAEVARYQKQLADCVNCPSTSSTPEGKAAIQELSNKISVDQGRIRQIEACQAAANDPVVLTAKPADPVSGYTIAGAAATLTDTSKGDLVNAVA